MDELELIAEIQERMDRLAQLGVFTTAIVTSDTLLAVKFHGDPGRPDRRKFQRDSSKLH